MTLNYPKQARFSEPCLVSSANRDAGCVTSILGFTTFKPPAKKAKGRRGHFQHRKDRCMRNMSEILLLTARLNTGIEAGSYAAGHPHSAAPSSSAILLKGIHMIVHSS